MDIDPDNNHCMNRTPIIRHSKGTLEVIEDWCSNLFYSSFKSYYTQRSIYMTFRDDMQYSISCSKPW